MILSLPKTLYRDLNKFYNYLLKLNAEDVRKGQPPTFQYLTKRMQEQYWSSKVQKVRISNPEQFAWGLGYQLKEFAKNQFIQMQEWDWHKLREISWLAELGHSVQYYNQD